MKVDLDKLKARIKSKIRKTTNNSLSEFVALFGMYGVTINIALTLFGWELSLWNIVAGAALYFMYQVLIDDIKALTILRK